MDGHNVFVCILKIYLPSFTCLFYKLQQTDKYTINVPQYLESYERKKEERKVFLKSLETL